MKVIIAGSRSITDLEVVRLAFTLSNFVPTEIVSGMAKGVDTLALELAEQLKIPVKKMPADWQGVGRGAGWKRNESMAEYADALIAIWDGESRGTKHMIDIARMKKLPMFVYNTSTKGAEKTGGGVDNKAPGI